jgi:hypothetical protein
MSIAHTRATTCIGSSLISSMTLCSRIGRVVTRGER